MIIESQGSRHHINIEQARQRIGCSRQHVYRLLAEGKIKGYRYGIRRGIRIYADSVEQFIQKAEIIE